MLGGFLDSANKSFDKRFLLAYWYPTLLNLLFAFLVYSWPKDLEPVYEYFAALQNGDYSFQLMIFIALIIFTFVIAHLLQAFSRPIVQFWEGYHPQWFWEIYSNFVDRNKKHDKVMREYECARINKQPEAGFIYEKLFYEYSAQFQLATKLGSVIRSAEDYAPTRYRMRILFWWPRLWVLLPEAFKEEMDDSEAPMLALLNLTTQVLLTSIVGFIYLITQGTLVAALVTFFGGILLAFILYHGAVSQARTYGNLIRTAVDLYRFELLKALHIEMPTNMSEEEEQWNKLYDWLYQNDQTDLPSYDIQSPNDQK
ncbi:MAG: hypothetical protein QCI00_07460 [Candidatus Thermoplasmatota archaeon]|nr:hypothetical protein [Candidatus Thermoplasmatota archaeon]